MTVSGTNASFGDLDLTWSADAVNGTLTNLPPAAGIPGVQPRKATAGQVLESGRPLFFPRYPFCGSAHAARNSHPPHPRQTAASNRWKRRTWGYPV